MRVLSKIIILTILLHLSLFSFSQEDSAWAGKKSGWLQVTPAQRNEVFQYSASFMDYLRNARSAESSTREFVKMAKSAGFAEFTAPAQVKPGAKLILPGRGRALILAVIGHEPITAGTRLVAAHHDSPHIDLKARPIYPAKKAGLALFKTVYYGGIKKYQWANLPLALIGRIDTTDGRTIDVSIGLDPSEPVFVIADNAPHSDKDLRTRSYMDVFKGEEMDPVVGSIPNEKSSVVAEVMRVLQDRYHIKEEDFVSADLQLVPATMPRDVGIDRGLIGAYGQDDRLSSYCAVRSLIETQGTSKYTALVYLSNFEEVGSVNNTGAASQFLNTTYAQLISAQRGKEYTDLDLRSALHNAQVISADTNDGINPIFPETSEETNASRVGYGVSIKRYGHGFDANSEYTAHIRSLFEKGNIPWQTQTPKVDVGGGGTIGGFMSQQDMEVIDLGIPLLSMHATLEMSSKVDVWNYYRFMKIFLVSE